MDTPTLIFYAHWFSDILDIKAKQLLKKANFTKMERHQKEYSTICRLAWTGHFYSVQHLTVFSLKYWNTPPPSSEFTLAYQGTLGHTVGNLVLTCVCSLELSWSCLKEPVYLTALSKSCFPLCCPFLVSNKNISSRLCLLEILNQYVWDEWVEPRYLYFQQACLAILMHMKFGKHRILLQTP